MVTVVLCVIFVQYRSALHYLECATETFVYSLPQYHFAVYLVRRETGWFDNEIFRTPISDDFPFEELTMIHGAIGNVVIPLFSGRRELQCSHDRVHEAMASCLNGMAFSLFRRAHTSAIHPPNAITTAVI